VITSTQILLTSQGTRSEFVGAQIASGATLWVVWAMAAPLVIALDRRFDFRKGRRISSLVAHLLALAACQVAMAVLMVVVVRAFRLPGPPGATWQAQVTQILTGIRIATPMLIYVAIAGLARAIRVMDALRVRELEASRLEAQAVRARLEALAARLEPHFLFNSLHAVGALMQEDPARARAMLAELGDLLRDLLRDAGTAEICLREELAFLNRFLAIAQIRFADRLRVETRIAPDTLDLLVPRFLLQPLVENALRHGLDRRLAAGLLRIEASRRESRLCISVWNDGPPLPETVREGFGLAATRERLHTRYGAGATVRLRSLNGGVEAAVELPV
jgi:LytS/YehU family sensor histidine kinase